MLSVRLAGALLHRVQTFFPVSHKSLDHSVLTCNLVRLDLTALCQHHISSVPPAKLIEILEASGHEPLLVEV